MVMACLLAKIICAQAAETKSRKTAKEREAERRKRPGFSPSTRRVFVGPVVVRRRASTLGLWRGMRFAYYFTAAMGKVHPLLYRREEHLLLYRRVRAGGTEEPRFLCP